MSDLFGELTSSAAEGAGTLGPEPSNGADLPAAGTQIALVRKEALDLAVNEDFRVATSGEAVAAGEALVRIKGLHKRLEAEKKARTSPLKDQIITIECEYTEPRDLLIKIEQKLKVELLAFRNVEQKQLEEQRRLELQVAEKERARLEEQAKQDREAAAKRAAKLFEQGREAQAASVLRTGESNAMAKERTAALVAAPAQPTTPTKISGVSVRKTWHAKVINLRRFLTALAGSSYAIEEFVTIKQQPLDRLAGSLQHNMDEVLPGSIAWEDDSIAARSK